MTEEEISQTILANAEAEAEAADGTESMQDMDVVEPHDPQIRSVSNPNPAAKRDREEGGEEEEEAKGAEEDNTGSKKPRVDNSVEEQRLEELEEEKEEDGKEEKGGTEEQKKEEEKEFVKLGPKNFGSSVEMFDYFLKLLHSWLPCIDINEYEHMALLDLLIKGHAEADKKIGEGVHAFQVRNHPMWKSRCFFLIREDGSADDFSFRKCVDKILPLPDHLKAPTNKDQGMKSGGHHKGGRGGGHGGRGGRGRGQRGGYRK